MCVYVLKCKYVQRRRNGESQGKWFARGSEELLSDADAAHVIFDSTRLLFVHRPRLKQEKRIFDPNPKIYTR
jgi:hypothetical protein